MIKLHLGRWMRVRHELAYKGTDSFSLTPGPGVGHEEELLVRVLGQAGQRSLAVLRKLAPPIP